MYRPEIKVMDCTIRDGGLTNNSHFTLETVRAVYEAVVKAGVDYVELGYRNNRRMLSGDGDFGVWRFCDEEHLRQVTDGIDPGETTISIMMDAHKSQLDDLLPRSESVVGMVRVATYVKDIDKAILLANDAEAKGYETTVNIMAISTEPGPALDEALEQIEAETKTQAVYVVDSYGAMYSEEVHYLVERYQMKLKTKEVGVHFHNSQQLGFANTIEGIIKGANYVDGTLYGLGRGSGNCPLELLLGFLKNPKYDLLPVLDVIGKHIIPLQKDIEWGYSIPYMIAGVLNQHPREAIAWMDDKNESKHDYAAFYRRVSGESEL